MMMDRKIGEIDWDEAEVNISTTGSIFVNLEEGETRLRIVSKPYQYYFHWIEDITGARRKVNCALNGCPVCAEGDQPKVHWLIKVLLRNKDGSPSAVKILDIGPQIFGQIRELNRDPEWGKVSEYDVKIIRGRKGSNPLYKTHPCNKTDFTEEEKNMLRKAKEEIKIDELVKPWSVEKINEAIHGRKSTNEDDFDIKLSDTDTESLQNIQDDFLDL